MIRYPTPLYFDASGSAIFRPFIEKVAIVKAHVANLRIPRTLMACPDDVGMLDNRPCLFCASHKKVEDISKSYEVITGWDLHKDRWCIFMAPPFVMNNFRDQYTKAGFRDLDMTLGMAPDVIMQRQGRQMLIELMTETAGAPRGKGDVPDIEDFMCGMQSRSIWAKYRCASEVPDV